jgi:hypothetical protein
VTKHSKIIRAASTNKVTAAQIKKGCPVEVQALGRRIAAHLQKVRDYEARAQEKAGVELRKADDNWTTVTQLLVEAKAKCDIGGFTAFKEKFCPNLSRSRIYELLQIGSGKKTVEQVKAGSRGRKAKQRAKNKAQVVRDSHGQGLHESIESPEVKPLSVTVTESAEVSIEQRSAEHAVLDLSPDEKVMAEYADWLRAADEAAKASAQALVEFTAACRAYLPKLVEADQERARRLVIKMTADDKKSDLVADQTDSIQQIVAPDIPGDLSIPAGLRREA